MLIYEVGGSIRDERLGLAAYDRDWVVVGSSAEELIAKGFKQVGSSFPVFLHPESKEEYALARSERKVSAGYSGFEVQADKSITLEEDLFRRDLTVNAIAREKNGSLIDVFNGLKDIENRVLRHISDAFVEDPLRVLRVARLQARLSDLGFYISAETLELMRVISKSGELEALSAERVWLETMRALQEPHPEAYFRVLGQVGALDFWFEELAAVQNKPQVVRWHPECCAGVHNLMVLEEVSKLSRDPLVRFCALVHDLGKGNTPQSMLPRHIGHEKRGAKLVERMGKRLKIPKVFIKLGKIIARLHGNMHKLALLRDSTCLKIMEQGDAFRNPNYFETLIVCSEADSKGRKWKSREDYPQAAHWRVLFQALRSLSFDEEVANNQGIKIAESIAKKRLAVIAQVRSKETCQ